MNMSSARTPRISNFYNSTSDFLYLYLKDLYILNILCIFLILYVFENSVQPSYKFLTALKMSK